MRVSGAVALVFSLLMGLLCQPLAAAPPASQPNVPPTAPISAPFSIAVLPLEENRQARHSDWLGLYLQDVMLRTFQRTTRTPTQDGETSRLWADKFKLSADTPPTPEQFRQMGVEVIIGGTLQTVLKLSEIHLRAQNARGDLLPGGGFKLRMHRDRDSPSAVVNALLQPLFQSLLPGLVPAPPAQPKSWEPVEKLYTLLAQPLAPARAGKPGNGTASRRSALEALVDTPGVAARAREALAVLLMAQAQLHTAPGAQRGVLLQQALAQVEAALQAEPLDTARIALKAELLYFLDRPIPAKTEASVARIKNPLNALALTVLGFTAGLSTGEATITLNKALSLDPFLRATNRPSAWPPFQGGVLEPVLEQWERLRQKARPGAKGAYEDALSRGKAEFDTGDYEEADQAFQEAESQETGDPTPTLFRHRILMENGRAYEAATLLRELILEHPDRADIQFYLAMALERSGQATAALKEFTKVLALDPNHPSARPHAALVLMGLERWVEARDALQPHLRQHPTDGTAWTALGIILLRMELWDEAESALREALTLNPDSPEAKQGMKQLSEQRSR